MSDLPVYSLKKIAEVRDEIFCRVLYSRLCTVPSGSEFDGLVADLSRVLPNSIRRITIYETARQLLGHEITEAKANEFADRVAGNLHTMRQHRPALPWSGQAVDEWVPVLVRRVAPARRRDDIGYTLRVSVLAGSCCPTEISRFWKRGMFSVVSPRIGFTPKWGQRPFQDPRQFVNLRFMVKIDAKLSTQQPMFSEVGCTTSHIDYNLEVLKRRFKIIPCPNRWTHECHRCAIGYETCPAGTHAKDFSLQLCRGCNSAQAFDPEVETGYCVHCTERDALART